MYLSPVTPVTSINFFKETQCVYFRFFCVPLRKQLIYVS